MKGLEHIILNKVNEKEVMFECKHCNLNLNVELPMNIVALVACKDTFIKIHRNCKQRQNHDTTAA